MDTVPTKFANSSCFNSSMPVWVEPLSKYYIKYYIYMEIMGLHWKIESIHSYRIKSCFQLSKDTQLIMVFFKPIKIDFGPFLDTVASKY